MTACQDFGPLRVRARHGGTESLRSFWKSRIRSKRLQILNLNCRKWTGCREFTRQLQRTESYSTLSTFYIPESSGSSRNSNLDRRRAEKSRGRFRAIADPVTEEANPQLVVRFRRKRNPPAAADVDRGRQMKGEQEEPPPRRSKNPVPSVKGAKPASFSADNSEKR